jgi:formylglycine-generating enzyme required for sulfatase activity
MMSATTTVSSNLIEELELGRAESDRFFQIIKPEGIYERPIDARHRVIFYIGHLDGFDSIQICREGIGLKSLDPRLDSLFQAGIDPDGAHLPADQPSDWPSLGQVQEYVARCRAHVDRYLDSAPEELVYMAMEHRAMHLETLAYMFHNFPYALKNVPPSQQVTGKQGFEPVENGWKSIPAGVATLGRPHDGTFGWDNEFDETRFDVPSFEIQRFSVTNGEYLKYVNEGAPMPHFWVRRDDVIFQRGMFGEIPLPLSWPVYVTQAEAQAYADAHGLALPTEQQFHRAAYGTANGRDREYPWGNDRPSVQRGNFDFQQWDPKPVSETPGGDSAFGASQLVGNGWEWTCTPFGPLPGFSPRPSYPGYSANFFDGQHFVLKGGSARTAARLLRRSFRNWFRRDYPFLYAKFRCVSK